MWAHPVVPFPQTASWARNSPTDKKPQKLQGRQSACPCVSGQGDRKLKGHLSWDPATVVSPLVLALVLMREEPDRQLDYKAATEKQLFPCAPSRSYRLKEPASATAWSLTARLPASHAKVAVQLGFPFRIQTLGKLFRVSPLHPAVTGAKRKILNLVSRHSEPM